MASAPRTPRYRHCGSRPSAQENTSSASCKGLSPHKPTAAVGGLLPSRTRGTLRSSGRRSLTARCGRIACSRNSPPALCPRPKHPNRRHRPPLPTFTTDSVLNAYQKFPPKSCTWQYVMWFVSHSATVKTSWSRIRYCLLAYVAIGRCAPQPFCPPCGTVLNFIVSVQRRTRRHPRRTFKETEFLDFLLRVRVFGALLQTKIRCDMITSEPPA